MSGEIWRDVVGFEGFYMVSSLGSIKNSSGVEMKCFDSGAGYMMIGLTKNGRRHKKKVHRLVAEAFIPNTEGKAQVNHKNGVKSDNAAGNLEWVTPRENMKHSYKLGRHCWLSGRRGRLHVRSKPVIATNLKSGEKRRFESMKIAEDYGFNSGAISQCCQGKNWQHKGYEWSYDKGAAK